jgi:hypothetical protein
MKHWLMFCLLLSVPSLALAAAEPLDWKIHGVTALVIAIVLSIFFIKRNKELSSTTAKLMAFGVYFWVIIFAEAILYGAYYGLIR